MARPKEWWERFWKDRTKAYGEPNETIIRFASDFIKSSNGNKTAVDIGSGNGRYAAALAKMGYLVDAIELSNEGVSRIKELSELQKIRVNVLQGDFTKLCEEKRQYDLVLCSGLLEEIDQEHHENVVKGFINWTKPGGMNIIKYCLEIRGRGVLVKENYVRAFYDRNGWDVRFFKENKEMHISKAKITFEGDIDSAIRTGTLVALKP